MPDLIDTIKALAEAPCPGPARRDCQGMGPALHTPHCHEGCNGTGRHPLTEPLRNFKCRHITSNRGTPKHAQDYGGCPGYRAATPQEAEAVGLKLLEAMPNVDLLHREKGWETFHLGFPVVGDKRWSPTPLEAILNALAEALGVEVEPDASAGP